MKQLFDFEEIRPFYDEEVPAVIESLIGEPGFEQAVRYIMPEIDYADFIRQMQTISNKRDFQRILSVPFLEMLARRTSSCLDAGGTESLDPKQAYTYLSNHRDIVLDASFLNLVLVTHGFDTCEVAIGDNLLKEHWIKDLVRLNKSFIVMRDVSVRKRLEISKRLSAYIRFAIKIKHNSLWIAQREGRAKNADDRTQESVLKMLNLSGGSDDVRANLEELNIVPVSISYEYDPCDYLKAREFQLKRDDPDYKKSPEEDLLNMEKGILGYKGHIHFQLTEPLNRQLETLPLPDDKQEAFSAVAERIDRAIHANYRIYPNNYAAYDLQERGSRFADRYTPEEKAAFENYLEKQIGKTQLEHPDVPFLREKLLEMYANPLRNQLRVTG